VLDAFGELGTTFRSAGVELTFRGHRGGMFRPTADAFGRFHKTHEEAEATHRPTLVRAPAEPSPPFITLQITLQDRDLR
jgi:hypothetical protein